MKLDIGTNLGAGLNSLSEAGETQAGEIRAVAVMAKHWAAGNVKTRLHGELGVHRAVELYREMLSHTLRVVNGVDGRRWLAIAPADYVLDAKEHLKSVFGSEVDWQVVPQASERNAKIGWHKEAYDGRATSKLPPDSLGVRLEALIKPLLKECQYAVVIGADCPRITSELMERAFVALHEAPLVLGPAKDGGYYMIGLRGPWQEAYSQLFHNMPWSTDAVASETRKRAINSGFAIIETELLGDVDLPSDLSDLRRYLDEPGCPDEFRRPVRQLFDMD